MINDFINQYGITIGIIIWVVIGVAKVLTDSIPNLIGYWAKVKETRQEREHERQSKEVEHKFQIEAVLISQLQAEVSSWSKFSREQVSTRLDSISFDIAEANHRISLLIEVLSDIVDERSSLKDKSEGVDINERDRINRGNYPPGGSKRDSPDSSKQPDTT